MSDEDSNDDGDARHQLPPAISRLHRPGGHRHRTLTRPTGRQRDRFQRLRRQAPIAALIGKLIEHYGLSDEVRSQAICLYWPEIAGERIASKTFPASFADGVLHVLAASSSWVHEMYLSKAGLILAINRWVDENRVWLGPPPLVTDIRFVLGTRHRSSLVDREHARELRLRHLLRTTRRPEARPASSASEAERNAIKADVSRIVDPELRALIESVRMKWNR